MLTFFSILLFARTENASSEMNLSSKIWDTIVAVYCEMVN